MDLMTNNNKKTVFSGVQPSGVLHLGNYLGALTQWVEMQNQYNCIFCVVDYHAITVKQEPKELNRRILDVVKTYLAAGINPEKAVIFQQSDVTAHTELAWILNCITNAGELKRMTQFNDKTGIASLNVQKESYEGYLKERASENLKKMIETIKNSINEKYSINKFINNSNRDEIEKLLNGLAASILQQTSKSTSDYFDEAMKDLIKRIDDENKKFNRSTVGLYDYPVLMAADILLYNTDLVPVGEDQVQHVELSRTLGQRFNREYGEVFKIPEAAVRKQGARIMGLDDPAKKMSKSASSSANYIALTDAPAVAMKKITRAVTDSGAEIKYDLKKKPAISNLLVTYSLLSGISIHDLEARYKNKGYGEFKKGLAEEVNDFLTKFQLKYNSFKDEEVRQILRDGADKVRPIAEQTLKKVKIKLGIN